MAFSLVAKLWALRALWRMFRYLRNWREVWRAYRSAQPLPPLHFRRGFVLNHGPADDPILLLHTVFARSEYAALKSGRTSVLIDIGANIGSVMLDRVWSNQELVVHAYEPNRSTFETLRRNVGENGLDSRVQLFNEAVTGQNGVAQLWSGAASVLSSTSAGAAIGGVSSSVATVTLEHAIRRTGAKQVAVKIDAEGAEVEMLEALSQAALETIDLLALEYHDSIVAGARVRCTEVLERAGFVCEFTPFNAHQGILTARRHLARPAKAPDPTGRDVIGR